MTCQLCPCWLGLQQESFGGCRAEEAAVRELLLVPPETPPLRPDESNQAVLARDEV